MLRLTPNLEAQLRMAHGGRETVARGSAAKGAGGMQTMMAPSQKISPSSPKISVVTPSFNQARFLESTIRSVLDQQYENLEYVIVDGGSSDGSQDIIERHGDRLAYWVSEKDRGHGHALNKGFERTTGEIMCWLNSDDMYLPWTFRIVAEIFTAFPDVNWIVGFDCTWSEHGALTAANPRSLKNIYDYLLGRYMWIQQESVFWRRSIWDRAGAHIDENFRLMVDGELWSRFFRIDSLYAVDCILAGYRVHSENRALTHMDDCHKEMERAIARMRQDCPPHVLSTGRVLNTLKRMKRLPPFGCLPMATVARLILGESYEKASYPILTYKSGKWLKSHVPFMP
jgi:Glycosyl transferase family 2